MVENECDTSTSITATWELYSETTSYTKRVCIVGDLTSSSFYHWARIWHEYRYRMCASRTFFKTDGHYSTKMWLACSMQHTRIALQPFNCIIDSAENIFCGVTTKTWIVDTKLFAKEPICKAIAFDKKRYHKSP